MSGVTWGSGARYSGVMYRSPPSPLVMIAGEVEAAVSSTVMSLQHLTCHVSHQPSVSARLGGRRATDRSVLCSLYTNCTAPLYRAAASPHEASPTACVHVWDV